MRFVLAAGVAATALALGGAADAQNSPAAQRVIDRARAVTGGPAGWNGLRGLHEVGEEGGVKIERWLDPLRYGLRQETSAADGGKLVQAYNGAAEWRVLAGGVLTGSDTGLLAAKVRSEAFFGAYGYFYPSRFDLRGSNLGVRKENGRSFEILQVQPAGGVPRELWFDMRTGLLAKMVEAAGEGTPLSIELSDYRQVGAVRVPFRVAMSGGDLAAPRERKLTSVDFRPADRAQFSLPPAPPPKPEPVAAPPAAAPAQPTPPEPDQKRGWRRWLHR